MKVIPLLFVFLLASSNCFSATTQCSSNAVSQAKKLLLFHSNGDDRADVESRATQLSSLTNPTKKSQKFVVFEVNGYIYKGNYRMRIIYYEMGKECVLMGQEILELATL